MKIKRIAIVGGGTAGWLAANHLGLELSRDPEIQITLIESKDIPIIGVGEGTVPVIRTSLQQFGVKELDLLHTCDATFKLGIKFSGWMDSEKHGKDHFYYNPFSPPFPQGFDVTHYWLNNRQAADFSKLSLSHEVAEANRSPKLQNSPPYSGAVHYAYHFNAAKFSELLASNARERFGIRHIFETIEQVIPHSDGSIKSLVYASGAQEEFDFYIDCSGFSAFLIGEPLNVPFVDKSSQILTDTAWALQVPTEPTDEIFPYTKATAHKAGWIWDIPLTTRRGTGFVYSSRHMSESEALQAFSQYHGRDLENANIRTIPMKTGYREKFWEKNCVALGLAQGFVEPLEATSILVTDFSASLIARNFPRVKEDIPALAKHCNQRVHYVWERVIDFIQLHYFISDRRDSAFWHDNTSNPIMSELLAERLAFWRQAIPQRTDFFSTFDFFGLESFLFVLYGMDYPTRTPDIGGIYEQKAKAMLGRQLEEAKKMAMSLMSHRDWLTASRQGASGQ